MKKLMIALAVVVLLLIVAGVATVITIDNLARTGIEHGATYATGVQTTLGSADVGITTGELTMDALNVANPPGYSGEHFLHLDRGHVAVGLGSLMSKQIEVPLVELRGLNLVVERAEGRNNFDVILENLRKLSSGEAEPRPDAKTYIIRKLVIAETTVSIQGFGISGKPITLPTIELTDVGSGGEGKALSHVVGIVIREVLASLLSDPSRLPDTLVASLGKGLEGLGELGQVGVQMVGKVGEAAGQVLEGAGDAAGRLGEGAGQVGEAVQGAGEGIKKGLGGLLGGGKDEPDQDADEPNP